MESESLAFYTFRLVCVCVCSCLKDKGCDVVCVEVRANGLRDVYYHMIYDSPRRADEHLFNGRRASITCKHTHTHTKKVQKRRRCRSKRNNNLFSDVHFFSDGNRRIVFYVYYWFFFFHLWRLPFLLLRHLSRAAGARHTPCGPSEALMESWC